MHKKIEQFSSNSKYIVCHDKVDFQTLDCMVARNDSSKPGFDQLERRDSKKFGDTEPSIAHGELDDTLALTSLCRGIKKKRLEAS